MVVDMEEVVVFVCVELVELVGLAALVWTQKSRKHINNMLQCYSICAIEHNILLRQHFTLMTY